METTIDLAELFDSLTVESGYSQFGLEPVSQRRYEADLDLYVSHVTDFVFTSGKMHGQLASSLGNTTYLSWYIVNILVPRRTAETETLYQELVERFLEFGARSITERRLLEAKERMIVGKRAFSAGDGAVARVGSLMVLRRLQHEGMFSNFGEAREAFEEMLQAGEAELKGAMEW